MTRARMEEWIQAEDGLSLVGDREDPEYEWVLVAETEGADGGRVEIRRRPDGDRVAIVRGWALPADTTPEKERGLYDKAAKAIGRPPVLGGLGVRREQAAASTLELSTIVYEDGLSRHTFMTALRELLRAGAGANDAMEKAGARDAFAPAPAPTEPLEQEAPPPPPAQAETFAATHVVPEPGMNAWSTPDPEAAVAAQLAAGVELKVLEERGAWAHVKGSNGWTGWVDGRLLQRR